MEKDLEKKLKKQLEAEKNKLAKGLKFFAQKDPGLKGNWLTRFPFFNRGRADKDEMAEEVEAYENLLPVEHSLESRLKDTSEALDRIKKGTYGKCEKCQKEIEIKRLEVVPEASLCVSCAQKESK